MTDQIVERHENPHVERPPQPLLVPHAFQPASLVTGAIFVVLGTVFLAHQLGAVSLGPVPTIFLGAVVVAAALVGLAFGWARREGDELEVVDGALSDRDDTTGSGS
jgi:hypothetical protein